jgi:hypothetical protein
VRAELGVQAIAHEAARTCAEARSAASCLESGLARAAGVAAGYGFDTRRLDARIDAGTFDRGGLATAHVRYPVSLLGGTLVMVVAASDHSEPIDRYASRDGARS